MKHIRSIAFLTIICLVVLAGSASALNEIAALHYGPDDPETEGWAAFRGPIETAAIINDGGIHAWKIEDTGGGQEGGYQVALSGPQILDAQSNGWKLSFVLRLPNDNQPRHGAVFVGVNLDGDHFFFNIGAAGGTPEIEIVGSNPVSLTGLDNGYHLYEVVFNPGDGTTDVFVDGVEKVSDVVPLTGVSFQGNTVSFGSGAGGGAGNAYYNLVKFEIDPIETSAISVTETDGSTFVNEDGLTDTFTMVLNSQPASNVTVSLMDLSDPNEVLLSPETIEFTTSDWSTPKAVSVEAIDDAEVEFQTVSKILLTITSGDPDFDGAFVLPVLALVDDNDAPELIISESDGITEVSEDGLSDTYTIALNIQPTADVTVYLEDIEDPNQVTISPESLVFTNSDWSTGKTVTVQAIDDALPEGGNWHDTTIAHTSVSADPRYDGQTLQNLTVIVLENDCGALGFNPYDVTGPEGEPDCEVNLADFAKFALEWLACSLPNTEGCVDYR